ncbi:MAG: hypothetical protein H7A46_09950 [Verrucomicrobiales bacterium]|nr:hypothetical protein [Verrucomicrobiales bacterium]
MNTTSPKTSASDRPVHEIRLGPIKAAIWANDTPSGHRHNVTFTRLFRDVANSCWRSSDSFGRDDLLLLAKVADAAHSWIHGQVQERGGHSQN